MRTLLARTSCLALAVILLCPFADASQKKHKKPKQKDVQIENYFGGVFLVTDGDIPGGPCFRINGRVTSGNFFDELKSYRTDDGMTFRLNDSAVAKFPDKVILALLIHDEPCSTGLQPVGSGLHLTKALMNSMSLSLYWKHGVDMQPAESATLLKYSVDPLDTYTNTAAADLPERFLWSYEFVIPSRGVPLTDSLVLVFRTPTGKMAARVAARL
ncbi:MAG TPA: hypothetical protein VJN93_10890 [Candidatus Acidoferrum sp.]|nr:hypothetical protein [Candidatus Acidoferrum sp.]